MPEEMKEKESKEKESKGWKKNRREEQIEEKEENRRERKQCSGGKEGNYCKIRTKTMHQSTASQNTRNHCTTVHGIAFCAPLH